MNIGNLTNIFKGSSGEYEVNRTVGGIGVLVYIVSVPSFTAWSMARGHDFDVIAFCTAYPTGLGLAIGAIAGAVAIKDRNVAKAKTETAAAAVVQADAEGRS